MTAALFPSIAKALRASVKRLLPTFAKSLNSTSDLTELQKQGNQEVGSKSVQEIPQHPSTPRLMRLLLA